MSLSDLTSDEIAELDDAVLAAYRPQPGVQRTHSEAAADFLTRILPDAVQAHRRWADAVQSEALERGLRNMLQERWKARGGKFVAPVAGRDRVRDRTRGKQVVDAQTGLKSWTQMELDYDSAEDLQDKIADAVRDIDENRANIAIFRKLLDLIESTGAPTVAAALAAVGETLEGYLAS
jgi:hypothetical protein